MSVSWLEPTRVLVGRVERGIGGLWSLLYAAEIATLQLALVPGLDDDLSLTDASARLGAAIDELEQLHPELPQVAVAVDMGPAALDDVTACRTAILTLIKAAHDVISEVIGDPRLTSADIRCIARAVHRLTAAHGDLTGRA